MTSYSEDALIEQPAIKLFSQIGWKTIDCFEEIFGPEGTLGRNNPSEVILIRYLKPALQRLNPALPDEAISIAIEELSRDRSTLSTVAANREIYQLLKEGVKVNITGTGGEQIPEVVKIIDWNNPDNNDFLICSQLWITGEMYNRRADLVGFVNGIPLVFIELKAAHKRIEDAFNRNLKDYKNTIPQIFRYNGLIILSNGSQSKIGSVTSQWEHFADWKKINSEGEEGIISLETMIKGTCAKDKLLELIENFILFEEAKGGYIKLIAKNHQYLGVNNAIEAVRNLGVNRGRLGVFWHTQGSGKSYSMIFFAQKIFRKISNKYTFVIVTDRDELDGQIYKNFARTGTVTDKEAQATSGENLKQLLQEDHRYIFTLIQKFRTEPGEQYPKLSDRSDIIVITDEAHRSQYDTFALNMRNALPKASFIGFTGTPLMVGEEKTRQVFGDYVSIYNFKQSADDKATVPLYYENRSPELQLTNENLNEDMEALLEEAELDEEQEKKLEREFAREYHLITRDYRLEKIAEDIVAHFMGRGFYGKAMVVSIDKATAVKMYDKVQSCWKLYLARLQEERKNAPKGRQQLLDEKIAYMKKTDMAVVVSQSQNEIELMKAKGLDIVSHRRRMVREDLDEKFKDPKDPFRIVFVCAMWMTGFDVPCCSTIYLDKPMRNHTLMQTIARANRVFAEKENGLIVDYVGVFRNLQKALAIYGSASGGGVKEGESPIKDKAELVKMMYSALSETEGICRQHGIQLDVIEKAKDFEKVKLLDDAVEAIVVTDETKQRFLSAVNLLIRLYKAVLPDISASKVAAKCRLLSVLAEKIRSLVAPADISEVMGKVEALLDESIATEGYIIREMPEDKRYVDLSKIDFEALKKQFEKSRKHIEIEKLRGAISSKLAKLVRLNRTRIDFYEKFREMIEEYNAGSLNADEFFDRLLKFAKELDHEEKRGISEQLSEEELVIFDILTKPEISLTEKDRIQVKKVARQLLETLHNGKLVLDWRKKQQAQATVQVTIAETLEALPDRYDQKLYQQKCNLIYQHIFDSYYGENRSIYAIAV